MNAKAMRVIKAAKAVGTQKDNTQGLLKTAHRVLGNLQSTLTPLLESGVTDDARKVMRREAINLQIQWIGVLAQAGLRDAANDARTLIDALDSARLAKPGSAQEITNLSTAIRLVQRIRSQIRAA